MKLPHSLIWLLALVLSLNIGCKSTSKTRASTSSKARKANESTILDNITKSTDLNGLVKHMSGTYVSSAHNPIDSSFFEVILHTTRIWSTKTEKFLYVEQAIVGQESTPTKQQVYKLQKDDDGGFEIVRFKLSNSGLFKGKWNEPTFFDQYDESILEEEEGCTLYVIQHADGSYSGSTRMDHCLNSDEGAAYSTTTLKVREDQILSWEQGFSSDKVQVWGAEKGGYRFIRK